jgi:hypothetical protein
MEQVSMESNLTVCFVLEFQKVERTAVPVIQVVHWCVWEQMGSINRLGLSLGVQAAPVQATLECTQESQNLAPIGSNLLSVTCGAKMHLFAMGTATTIQIQILQPTIQLIPRQIQNHQSKRSQKTIVLSSYGGHGANERKRVE